MEIGLVGLGRMGGNMARRWMRGGHRVVGHARSASTLEAFSKEGLVPAATLEDLASRLKPPRAVRRTLTRRAKAAQAMRENALSGQGRPQSVALSGRIAGAMDGRLLTGSLEAAA